VFKIVGNHDNKQHNSVLHKLIKQFVPYSQEKLGWDQPVTINLLADPENAHNPLGKTAYYEPNSKKITLFTSERHPKDILRSLSHELVHHKQNCQGLFTGGVNTRPGYAQEDGHLRKMEEDAYLEGNMKFRDWEDHRKQQKQENKQMDVSRIVNEVMDLLNEEEPDDLKKDWKEKQGKMAAAAAALKPPKSWKEVTKDDGAAWTARLAAREAYKKMKKATAGDKEGAAAASGAGSKLDPKTRQLYTKQLGILKQYKTKIDGLIDQRTKALANEGKQVGFSEAKEKINEAEPGTEQANVRFTKGPCKGMTAKEAMKKRCKPGPGDHITEGNKHDCDKVHPNISHEAWKEKQEKLAESEKTNENWFKSGKDRLIFEELTKKWAK